MMIMVRQVVKDVYGNRCKIIMRVGAGGRREIEEKREKCKAIDKDGYK